MSRILHSCILRLCGRCPRPMRCASYVLADPLAPIRSDSLPVPNIIISQLGETTLSRLVSKTLRLELTI